MWSLKRNIERESYRKRTSNALIVSTTQVPQTGKRAPVQTKASSAHRLIGSGKGKVEHKASRTMKVEGATSRR